MEGFGYACAVVLAVVFVRAAVAKAVRPAETTAGFVALGVPSAPRTARVVPAVELILALALLAVPMIGGAAALALLGAFTGFLARALRAGVTAGCNCFGQARADPISGLDLVRNVLLGLLAAAALSAEQPVVPAIGAAAVVAAAVVAGGLGLRLARTRLVTHPRR